VLDKIRRRFPWLELIWADGGYNAWQVDAVVAKVLLLRLAIIKRSDDVKGFVVLPRRWVLERTFSWFGRNRRLAEDFENLADTLATFVTLASIQLPSDGWPERSSAASILLPAANGGWGCAEGTFAGSHGNGKDAPMD
jgi:transposase